jgi:transmembrane sensor
MSPQDDDRDVGGSPVSEEAAYWMVQLSETGTAPAEREDFARWVRRSPERVEAFLRMQRVSSTLKAGAVRWPDTPAAELVSRARAAPGQVVTLHHWTLPATTRSANPSMTWSTRMFVAAALVALLALAIMLSVSPSERSYQTAVGEQRSVALDDGSIVTINTASEILVRYNSQRRLVWLVRGEAMFDVSHDAQRPFDVAVGDVVVRAVGTRFNVDRRAAQTTVTVMEGTVKVIPEAAPARAISRGEATAGILKAAQRMVLSNNELGVPEPVANPAPDMAWTRRQLVFENQPLSEVAAEFNRYNRRHILIRSPSLEQREITGVFQANDSYPLLVFISAVRGAHVETTADGDYVITTEEQMRPGEGASAPP